MAPTLPAANSGSGVAPRLDAPKVQLIITKGSQPDQEAYSGFHGTNLAKILRDKGVHRVVVWDCDRLLRAGHGT